MRPQTALPALSTARDAIPNSEKGRRKTDPTCLAGEVATAFMVTTKHWHPASAVDNS